GPDSKQSKNEQAHNNQEICRRLRFQSHKHRVFFSKESSLNHASIKTISWLLPPGSYAMIPRYTRPEMARVWSDANKLDSWLTVEIAVCEAWAERGVIPKEAMEKIRRARYDAERAAEYEREMHHDFNAFRRPRSRLPSARSPALSGPTPPSRLTSRRRSAAGSAFSSSPSRRRSSIATATPTTSRHSL